MKRLHFLLISAIALMVSFSGCKKEEITPEPNNSIGTFKLADIVDGAAAAYKTFEDDGSFPATFKVGSKDLTTPEYQYAICKALVNISAGKKDDIKVLSYKAASHPDRDSYDKETIAVVNGPKNGDETEDVVNIATRMLKRMEEDLTVPNQTNFTRNGNPIAFSTERATTVISRVLAGYKTAGKLEGEVSASFKAPGATIKAFAQEYVKIIAEWEKNVGTINRLSNWELAQDGDKDVVENAHYVPNTFTITVKDRVYTTGEILEIATRSYLLLRGYDGNDTDAVGFGTFPTVTPVTMNNPIPDTHEFGWNSPLIETSNGGYLYKVVDGMEKYGVVDPVILENWAMRSINWSFGNENRWTNFCSYPRDPITGYKGIFSSGRALLTYAFFYKYMLDNNLEKADNLDATVEIRSELFGIETANNDKDIQIGTAELEFDCSESEQEAVFAAKKAWTAETSDNWITVEPASGEAGTITVKVKVAANTGDAREGKVIIKGGNVTDGLEIAVKQAKYVAPSVATIKSFAQEYVKIIDIWANTVGTIDYLKGEEAGSNPVENAHYVPMATTIEVEGKTYKMADMWETAIRSYLLVRGYDGLDTEKYGAGSIPALTDGAKPMSTTVVPQTHEYSFGSLPYAEPSNGGYLYRKGEGDAKIYGKASIALLDNFAMRALNFSHGKDISNMCTYPRDPITTYGGCFSSMRALITYAFFFKFMLENGLDTAENLSADLDIRTELFGVETASETTYTIKDFAQEYVKILKIWENNVGTIDYLTGEKPGSNPVENAHFVPMSTTIMLGNKVYTTADMWETALRCYLLVRGYDGLDTEKYGAGSIPALTDGAKAMSTTEVPATHQYSFGQYPYAEPSNGGYLYKKGEGDAKIYGKVDIAILDNFAMRALNYAKGQNISNMCTYPRDPITNYGGCFSSMRALITYAFAFKALLDSGLDKGDAIPATYEVRSELFGVDTPLKVQWNISGAAAQAGTPAYGNTFGGANAYTSAGAYNGTAKVLDNKAGDGGRYFDANYEGKGRITYVQVDKAAVDSFKVVGRVVGSTGHPYVVGTLPGDYWLFTATKGSQIAAGKKIHAKYIFRCSKGGVAHWLVEYFDGNEWKPASLKAASGEESFAFAEVQTETINEETVKYNVKSKTDGSKNTVVETTFTLAAPVTTVQLRMVAASSVQAQDCKTPLQKLNEKDSKGNVPSYTSRIASAKASDGTYTATSPLIEEVVE